MKTKIQAYKGFQVLSGLNCVIARALGAGELLRILQQRVALRVTQVVLMLCIDVGAAHLDDRELVAPDAPVENFLLAGLRFETPAGLILD